MRIEVKNLFRKFGKCLAVNDVSFDFSSGSIVGFIGPNGAGKTTAIKIMSTLDLPDSGDVFYDGTSVVLKPDEVRRIIGYMPDSLPDYKDVMVWEYLDFFARSFGLKGDERRRTLSDIEEFTSLGEMRYKYLASLSKGMKQRVSLGRTLIHNPKVLIMDEPAAGLDPRARLELRSLLKILSGQGKAILLSSHILSELQDICDAAVIIEKGKILSAGKINNMLAEGEKKRLKSEEVLQIKSLQQSEAVNLKLMENPLIGKISVIDENEVHAEFTGDAAAVAELLRQLNNANIKVVEFTRRGMGLEELFMRITSGEVQ